MLQELANDVCARPDLDADMQHIDEWDQLRQRADQLRTAGIENLWKILQIDESGADTDSWFDEDSEPDDVVCIALMVLAGSREFVRTTKVSPKEFLLTPPTHGNSQLNKIRQLSHHCSIGPFIGTESMTFRVPTFQAARVLQALLSVPKTVFSCRAMLAYYVVVRELATVSDQKWILGSGRASSLGEASAFVTGECARSVSAMARALENTAELIEEFIAVCSRWHWVDTLARAPKGWKAAENRRIALAAYNDLSVAARRGGISLVHDNDVMHLLTSDGEISPFFEEFCNRFQEAADSAEKGISQASKAIEANHEREIRKIDDAIGRLLPDDDEAKHRNEVKRDRLALSHKIAKGTINGALLSAQSAARAANSLRSIASGSTEKSATDEVKKLIDSLRRRAAAVRRLLDPTKAFLASVIDREVQQEVTGQLSAGELACAAAAYAALEKPDKPELDRRLRRATQILCDTISVDGTFAITSILDADDHGYNAAVETSEVLRAFAYLLQKVSIEVPTEILRRLLRFYESNAVRLTDGNVIGWAHDQSLNPLRAYRWTSALAILALDRITRMLSLRINDRVFRHFSVISPKDFKGLQKKPKLGTLFYPDYGLAACEDKKYHHEDPENGSVAFALERMRTHVLEGGAPPGYQKGCHSLVLYGPPGTGKTTLIESLAATSNTHYVEITSSDFLVHGGAFIERRARNVMRALSFLTRTVILFDEFDPIVRSRDESRPLNEFEFVTPGMLPKLKLLYNCAEQRQVAYCLITNRIGTLDGAAIRAGRFDMKIGVYPPDLLSRAGRLIDVVSRNGNYKESDHLDHLVKVVHQSAGLGMTHLGKPGNFSPWTKQENPPKGFVQRIFFESDEYSPAPADADPNEAPVGEGPHTSREVQQWCWVQVWDQSVPKNATWDIMVRRTESPPALKTVIAAVNRKNNTRKEK